MEFFVSKGLLSLCLRCLSSPDDALRRMACRAVGLYREWLTTPEATFRCLCNAGNSMIVMLEPFKQLSLKSRGER